MKTLVIYAHPEHKGHCSTILDNVKKNIDCEILDLYKIKFNPLLTPQEYAIKPKVMFKGIQQKIAKADNLIFIYPHWWGGMPAILKGFFDRVFTHGFAFKFEGDMPEGLLTNKKAIVFKTYGGPFIFQLLMGNHDAHVIKNDILGFCGIKAKVYPLGGCKKLNKEKKDKINVMVEKALSKL